MSDPADPILPLPSPYKTQGARRLIVALGHSWRGLRAAWRTESAFRQEIAAAAVMLPLGVHLGRDGTQRALLISSVLLVLLVELLNSALEAAVDRISLDRHELSRAAKDMGSAAVLLTLMLCAAIWLSILLPRLR